jgi:hypothetical protein
VTSAAPFVGIGAGNPHSFDDCGRQVNIRLLRRAIIAAPVGTGPSLAAVTHYQHRNQHFTGMVLLPNINANDIDWHDVRLVRDRFAIGYPFGQHSGRQHDRHPGRASAAHAPATKTARGWFSRALTHRSKRPAVRLFA